MKTHPTRQELMEYVYNQNKFCSAGDIALALSKRFGRCQGNRKLADGSVTKSHIQMGAEFLMQKRKEREVEKENYHKQQMEKNKAFYEFKSKAWMLAQKMAKELKEGFRSSEFYEVLCENVGQGQMCR